MDKILDSGHIELCMHNSTIQPQ